MLAASTFSAGRTLIAAVADLLELRVAPLDGEAMVTLEVEVVEV